MLQALLRVHIYDFNFCKFLNDEEFRGILYNWDVIKDSNTIFFFETMNFSSRHLSFKNKFL